MYSEHPIYGEELFLYGEGDKYILPNIPTTDTGLSYIVAAKKVYNGEKPRLMYGTACMCRAMCTSTTVTAISSGPSNMSCREALFLISGFAPMEGHLTP